MIETSFKKLIHLFTAVLSEIPQHKLNKILKELLEHTLCSASKVKTKENMLDINLPLINSAGESLANHISKFGISHLTSSITTNGEMLP
jgi:hypothetical protein